MRWQTSRLEFRILGPLTVTVDGAAIADRRAEAACAARAAAAERQPCRLARAADRRAVCRAERQFGRSRAAQPRFAVAQGARGGTPGRAAPRRARARLPAARRARASSTSSASSSSSLTGREALAAGDAGDGGRARCARPKRLWQGRPLADLEFEPFARVEVERLEELRLAAVEERIDAELALGRHLRARLRARGARRRAPVPRALPGAADARALPLRQAGRGARGVPADAALLERRARARARASSCSSSSGRSSCRTPR